MRKASRDRRSDSHALAAVVFVLPLVTSCASAKGTTSGETYPLQSIFGRTWRLIAPPNARGYRLSFNAEGTAAHDNNGNATVISVKGAQALYFAEWANNLTITQTALPVQTIASLMEVMSGATTCTRMGTQLTITKTRIGSLKFEMVRG